MEAFLKNLFLILPALGADLDTVRCLELVRSTPMRHSTVKLGDPMALYHVLVCRDDGQVARTYTIDAGSEPDALARLNGARHDETVEIWTGTRMISRLEAAPSPLRPHFTGSDALTAAPP